MVQQGTPFTRTCSFTDHSGDGPWTATVNYGDGRPGTQRLALKVSHSRSATPLPTPAPSSQR